MKLHLSAMLLISAFTTTIGQNILITEKPVTIEDTLLSNIKTISETDVTKQFAYGVFQINDAGFFDLFGEPNGNELFLYPSMYSGNDLQKISSTGAISWNCWFGKLNNIDKIKGTLEVKSKNDNSPGELNLYAYSYKVNGKENVFVYFDLLPDVNTFSSIPFFDNNPQNKSSVGAIEAIALSEKPKSISASIKISYTNTKGEAKTISQEIKFLNLSDNYLVDERYAGIDTRKAKHYIYEQLPAQFVIQKTFDEKKAEISKVKAIELFEKSVSGSKVIGISYAQSYEHINKANNTVKSKAARCLVTFSRDGKCYFGDVYFRKINDGTGTFSESEFERLDPGGEIQCNKLN